MFLIWSNVRQGTLIVLRNQTGASADASVGASDFNLDINLKDLDYITTAYVNKANDPDPAIVAKVIFDIEGDNMVSLQRALGGTTNPIAILGAGASENMIAPANTAGSSFNVALTTKLNAATPAGVGKFTYVSSTAGTIADFMHVETNSTNYVTADNATKVKSDVTMNDDAVPVALVLGTPNNVKNLEFITGLRTQVLPVNLISFTAKKGINGIELNWATASEQNNNRFELQRSADGNSFVTIKTVTGANNANSRNNYSFLDKNPIAGVNYYKLVQIDNDGTVKELGVQAVSSDSKGLAFNVSSYGDVNQINYTVYATATGKANVSVFDLSGKQVANIAIDLAAGNNNLKINSNNLKSGVYVAVLKAENNTLTSKFVK
jgi:hypothetical protein